MSDYPVSALERELDEYARRIAVAVKHGDRELVARLEARADAVRGLLGVRESHTPAPVEKRPAPAAARQRRTKKTGEGD